MKLRDILDQARRLQADAIERRRLRGVATQDTQGQRASLLTEDEVLGLYLRRPGGQGGGGAGGLAAISGLSDFLAARKGSSREPVQAVDPTPTSTHWLEIELCDRTHGGGGLDGVVFCLDHHDHSTATTTPRGESTTRPGFRVLDPLPDAVAPELGSKLAAWLNEPEFCLERVVWEAAPAVELGPPVAGKRWLVAVTEVSPPPGDVVDGLRALATAEVDAAGLLQFNFGLSRREAERLLPAAGPPPAELYDLLYRLVGATELDTEGRLVFHLEDQPGKLYVPAELPGRALAIDQRHRLEVGRFAWPQPPRMTQVRVRCEHGESPDDHESAPIPRNYENPFFAESLLDGVRPTGPGLPPFIDSLQLVPPQGKDGDTAPTEKVEVYLRDTHALPPWRLAIERVAEAGAARGPSRTVEQSSTREAVKGGKLRRGDEVVYELVAQLPADDPIWGSKKAALAAFGFGDGVALPKEGKVAYSALTGVKDLELKALRRHFEAAWSGISPYSYRVPLAGTSRTLSVELFYPHVLELALKLPPWGKFSAGVIQNRRPPTAGAKVGGSDMVEVGDGALATGDLAKKLKTKAQKEEDAKQEAEEKKTWLGSIRHGTGDVAKAIAKVSRFAVTLDGANVTPGHLKLIGDLLKLVSDVLDIIQTCKEYVPAVGFYWDFEMSVLQGDFGLALGWGERTEDPAARAWRSLTASCDLTLIEIAFELGFGLKWGDIKVAVFIKLTGTLSWKLETSFTSDPFETTLEATFAAELGVMAETGKYAEVKATLSAALTVACAVRVGGGGDSWPFQTNASLEWTGIKGDLYASVSVGGVFGTEAGWKDKELSAPADLGSFVFPSNVEYTPHELSLQAIKERVHWAVTDWIDLRVETNEMQPWQQAYEVAEALMKIPNLARDHWSVESTCGYINRFFEAHEGRHGSKGSFSVSEFREALASEDFVRCCWRIDERAWEGVESWQQGSWQEAKQMVVEQLEAGVNVRIAGLDVWQIAWYIVDAIKLAPCGRNEQAVRYAANLIVQHLEAQGAGWFQSMSEQDFRSMISTDVLWSIRNLLLPWGLDEGEFNPRSATVKSLVHSALTVGWDITVYNAWSAWDIAYHIAAAIHDKPGARRDARSVEAAAIAIVDRLKGQAGNFRNKFRNDSNRTGEAKFLSALAACDDLIPLDPGKAYVEQLQGTP